MIKSAKEVNTSDIATKKLEMHVWSRLQFPVMPSHLYLHIKFDDVVLACVSPTATNLNIFQSFFSSSRHQRQNFYSSLVLKAIILRMKYWKFTTYKHRNGVLFYFLKLNIAINIEVFYIVPQSSSTIIWPEIDLLPR